MQETRNNCFGSKNVARPFFRRKQLSTSAEMKQQHQGRATFFDPIQMLRVSCILWCYYPQCYSIILQKGQFVELLCHIYTLCFRMLRRVYVWSQNKLNCPDIQHYKNWKNAHRILKKFQILVEANITLMTKKYCYDSY